MVEYGNMIKLVYSSWYTYIPVYTSIYVGVFVYAVTSNAMCIHVVVGFQTIILPTIANTK